MRAEILGGALPFLRSGQTDFDHWNGSAYNSYRARAGYQALYLLWTLEREMLLTLEPEHWGRWCCVLISFSTSGGSVEGQAIENALLEHAYHCTSQAFIESVLERVRGVTQICGVEKAA